MRIEQQPSCLRRKLRNDKGRDGRTRRREVPASRARSPPCCLGLQRRREAGNSPGRQFRTPWTEYRHNGVVPATKKLSRQQRPSKQNAASLAALEATLGPLLYAS